MYLLCHVKRLNNHALVITSMNDYYAASDWCKKPKV